MATLDLGCCTWAFSSCGAWASHCSGFSCGRAQALGDWASVVGSSWASLPRSMWNLPGPGIKPMSPALAAGFSTTVPPGKPSLHFYVEGNMLYFIPCSFNVISHGVLSIPVHTKHPYSFLQLHFTPWMYQTY